jgi:hypothetical protein
VTPSASRSAREWRASFPVWVQSAAATRVIS